jgi:hypothetical protein
LLTSSGVYPWLKRGQEARRHPLHAAPQLPRPRHRRSGHADKKAAEVGVWKDPHSLHRDQHVKPEAKPGRHVGLIFDLANLQDEPLAKPINRPISINRREV